MKIVKIKSQIDQKGKLQLEIPTTFPPGSVDVIIILQSSVVECQENNLYDFSDLIGKLEWNGDALAVQKELRNEW